MNEQNSSVVDFVFDTLEQLRNALICIPVIPYEQLTIFEKKRLGKGSFGAVYLGYDQFFQLIDSVYDDMQIVVKRLFTNEKMSKEYKQRYIRRLRREVYYGSSQDHPNLMKIYGISYDPKSDNDMPMMVMEYWGANLANYMRKMGSHITMEQRKQIILGIAYGLKYMHDQGLVHRDLKVIVILLTSLNSSITS